MVHRLPVSQISSEWLLTEEGFSLNTRGSLRRLKRAFDLFATLGLLICTSPIMLLTAIAIRVESPGPVIYRTGTVFQDGASCETGTHRLVPSNPSFPARRSPSVIKMGIFDRQKYDFFLFIAFPLTPERGVW